MAESELTAWICKSVMRGLSWIVFLPRCRKQSWCCLMQRIAHVSAAVCLCWPGAIKNWGLVGVGLVYTVRVEFQRLRQPSSHMTVKSVKNGEGWCGYSAPAAAWITHHCTSLCAQSVVWKVAMCWKTRLRTSSMWALALNRCRALSGCQ